jgi:ketosteroid isomerase-like protein
MHRIFLLSLPLASVVLAAPLRAQTLPAALKQQVFAAESSFAASFARRDTAAFAALIAPDAVFFGQNSVLRGKAAVVDGWRPMLTEPNPPFSWKPEVVEVSESGELAFSSGPVYGEDGKQFGVFNSIWRRQADGQWKVVFDKGCPVCNCAPKP